MFKSPPCTVKSSKQQREEVAFEKLRNHFNMTDNLRLAVRSEADWLVEQHYLLLSQSLVKSSHWSGGDSGQVLLSHGWEVKLIAEVLCGKCHSAWWVLLVLKLNVLTGNAALSFRIIFPYSTDIFELPAWQCTRSAVLLTPKASSPPHCSCSPDVVVDLTHFWKIQRVGESIDLEV